MVRCSRQNQAARALGGRAVIERPSNRGSGEGGVSPSLIFSSLGNGSFVSVVGTSFDAWSVTIWEPQYRPIV